MQLDHGDLEYDGPVTEKCAAYRKTKTALFALEQSAMFSTNSLAAQALMALHEIGHGIFPAAYLTVSSLARLFIALGLHDRKKATQILPRPSKNRKSCRLQECSDLSLDTWMETEERRRLWWAVLILDRYVHIGLRFRPLCTPKIPPDEILPARDASWDDGVSETNTKRRLPLDTSQADFKFRRN